MHVLFIGGGGGWGCGWGGGIFQLKPRFLFRSLRASNDHCTAPLAGSPQVLLEKIQVVINCSARLICKAPKSTFNTLYSSILTGYQSAVGFNTIQISLASRLSLVQLLHISLSCSISIIILYLRVPRMVRFWGRDPFNTSDL